MFKEICKVTETDCYDSYKIMKKPSSVRKKKRLRNTSFERKKCLILKLLHIPEFKASR